MEEKDMQRKYMEYQMLDEKIKDLNQKKEVVEQQLMEILATIESIDNLSASKDKSEILVPANKGIFAKAVLKKEDRLLVNVGSSVVVDKSFEETKALIVKQKNELEEVMVMIKENIRRLVARAALIEKDLREISSQEE
jgi:prefoldin alpha subunit